MTSSELVKSLWDLANGITAFAVIQGLVFVYTCAKKDVGDALNRKALKIAVAVMVGLIGLAQIIVVYWCGVKIVELDSDHSILQTQATIGRIVCISGFLVFSLLILFARQLFSQQPFNK